jgi:hypothetical protein
VPIVWKSGSLDLLEPCDPAQACNGTALLMDSLVLSSGCIVSWFSVLGVEFTAVVLLRVGRGEWEGLAVNG